MFVRVVVVVVVVVVSVVASPAFAQDNPVIGTWDFYPSYNAAGVLGDDCLSRAIKHYAGDGLIDVEPTTVTLNVTDDYGTYRKHQDSEVAWSSHGHSVNFVLRHFQDSPIDTFDLEFQECTGSWDYMGFHSVHAGTLYGSIVVGNVVTISIFKQGDVSHTVYMSGIFEMLKQD